MTNLTARRVAEDDDVAPEKEFRGVRIRAGMSAPTLLFLAGLAIEGSYVGVLVDRGYFFADDFINFDNVRASGLTFRSLATPIFGHFIPLFNLLNLAIDHVAPYNYPLIVGLIVGMFLATLFTFRRLLSLLSPARVYVNVLLTLLLGSSLITVPGTLWWSNAASNIPAICLSMLSIDGAWRYLSERRTHCLIQAAVCLALALGFFESSLIVLVAVALIWPLFIFDAGRDGKFVRATFGLWPLWIGLAVPTVADLGYRLAHNSSYVLSPRPTLAEMGQFFRAAWALGFGPGMVGVDYPYRAFLNSSVLTVVVGQIAIFGTIAVTMVIYRRAWRGWLLFFVTFFFYLLPTGFARAGYHGAGTGITYDYLFFGPYLLYIGFALSSHFGRRRVSDVAGSEDHSGAAGGPRGVLGFPVVGFMSTLALVGILSSTAVSAVSISGETSAKSSYTFFENPASPRSSRLFFDTALQSLTTIRENEPNAVIYDSAVSNFATGWWYNQDRADSEFVSDTVRWLHFGRYALTGYLLDSNGLLEEAYFDPMASAKFEDSSSSRGVAIRRPHGGGVCFLARSAGSVTVPFTSSAGVAPLPEPQMHLAYSSSSTTMTDLDFVAGAGETPALRYQPHFQFEKGEHSVLVDVVPNLIFDDVTFPLPKGAKVCLSTLQAGQPLPGLPTAPASPSGGRVASSTSGY